MNSFERGSTGGADFAPQRERASQNTVLFLPGKGVDTMGSYALAWTGAILYEPGMEIWVSGGFTDPEKDYSEASGIKRDLLTLNQAIPPEAVHREERSHQSWTNVTNSKEGIDQLNRSDLTVVGTRRHAQRVKMLCEENGWTQSIRIVTIEEVLGAYSDETRDFLRRYRRTVPYIKELLTEPPFKIYHRIDRQDRIPRLITHFSRNRGNTPSPDELSEPTQS